MNERDHRAGQGYRSSRTGDETFRELSRVFISVGLYVPLSLYLPACLLEPTKQCERSEGRQLSRVKRRIEPKRKRGEGEEAKSIIAREAHEGKRVNNERRRREGEGGATLLL